MVTTLKDVLKQIDVILEKTVDINCKVYAVKLKNMTDDEFYYYCGDMFTTQDYLYYMRNHGRKFIEEKLIDKFQCEQTEKYLL